MTKNLEGAGVPDVQPVADEREAFEAWAAGRLAPLGKDHPWLVQSSSGEWLHGDMPAWWKAWQARAALAAPQPAAVAALGDTTRLRRAITNAAQRWGEFRGASGEQSAWQDLLSAVDHALAAPLPAAQPALVADLRLAAETLRRYETLHRAKGTEDGEAKAKANAALAARFEATLAAQPSGQAVDAVEAERERFRLENARAVMPLIGPMLDAWDGADHDAQGVMMECGVGRHIKAIYRAITDPDIMPRMDALRAAAEQGTGGSVATSGDNAPQSPGGAPHRIYLVVGDDAEGAAFGDLHEVTWCAERHGPHDIEYVLAGQAQPDLGPLLDAAHAAVELLDGVSECEHCAAAADRLSRAAAAVTTPGDNAPTLSPGGARARDADYADLYRWLRHQYSPAQVMLHGVDTGLAGEELGEAIRAARQGEGSE